MHAAIRLSILQDLHSFCVAEREDLSATRPELVERLRSVLRSTLEHTAKGAVEGGVRKLSEEEVEQLRSLGYLDS